MTSTSNSTTTYDSQAKLASDLHTSAYFYNRCERNLIMDLQVKFKIEAIALHARGTTKRMTPRCIAINTDALVIHTLSVMLVAGV